MKKIKLLTPILGLTAMAGAVAPLASCSCGTTEEGAKAQLTITSTDKVTIKSSDVTLNKDSTVVLNLPQFKAISNVYINVGTVVLAKDKDFSVDVNTNTIKINGSALNNKDVEITVFTATMNGLKASLVDTTKKFEALETIKASDIKVYPTYDKELIGEINPLSYSTDYLVYDSDKEVENFDTVGYSVTRTDGRSGSKVLTIQYVAFDRYKCDLSFATCPRYEAVSIDSMYWSNYVVETDKLTTAGLNIRGTMTDGSSKKLEWGVDYTIWDGDTEITDFGENGYTFETEGTKVLTVKGVNPEIKQQLVTFNVQPVVYKNACCMTNESEYSATITLEQDGTAAAQPDLQYSKDKGQNWFPVSKGVGIPLTGGQTIMFKGNNPNGFNTKDTQNWLRIFSDNEENKAKINLFGSILGLLNNNDPKLTPTKLPEYCFTQLFKGTNTSYDALASVSQDFLTNVPLSNYCYSSMFYECGSLVDAPVLPATKLTEGCYEKMFAGCNKLICAPSLPAIELAEGCYSLMFNRCKALTIAPELPATELADNCYYGMFMVCSTLINAPTLPAEKLAKGCYMNMFTSCTSLKVAPKLPATTLEAGCYNSMFQNCPALMSAPELPAKILTDSCYTYMFMSCRSLTSVPELPAQTLAENCYMGMFRTCINLSIPPILSATKLFASSYNSMFQGCKALVINNVGTTGTAFFNCPDISATNCVKNMFNSTGGSYTSDPVANGTYYFE